MADTHIAVPEPTQEERSLMENRMLAFIYPNTPITNEEKEVFAKAAEYQIAHEKTIMSVSDSPLTRQNICPAAYEILLRVGLLHRGVKKWCSSFVYSGQSKPPTTPSEPAVPPDIPSGHLFDTHAHPNMIIDGNET